MYAIVVSQDFDMRMHPSAAAQAAYGACIEAAHFIAVPDKTIVKLMTVNFASLLEAPQAYGWHGMTQPLIPPSSQ